MAKLNRELHQTIYFVAHNRYLLQTLGQLGNALALLHGSTSVPRNARASDYYWRRKINDTLE
jgi:DNA-binding FadR family transcriptional regulator